MKDDILALKYRPKKLSDIIGQDATVKTLINSFASGKMYKTLVFAGKYGCGKTSCARIVAAMDNCEKGKTLEPCGVCKNCISIFDGKSIDVREVNAASKRGIDDIRELEDYAKNKPFTGTKKYIILDECHRLTADAAESALKFFEEPPDHIRIILATTDLHKMKITLNSRAMIFRYCKVPWQTTVDHLSKVAAQEKYNIEDGAIKIAAKLSDGSVRNALRNLQMLSAFSGNDPITTELAQHALGAIDDNLFFDYFNAILNKDVASCMKIVNNIMSKGIDFQQIFDGLLEHLRTLLVIRTCSNTSTLVYLSEDEKKAYLHQIGTIASKLTITEEADKAIDVNFLSTMISLLYNVARGVNLSINPQTLLENYAVESIMAFGKIERERKLK